MRRACANFNTNKVHNQIIVFTFKNDTKFKKEMNKIYLENLKVEPCFRSTKQNYVYCNSTPSQVKKPKLKW